MAPRAEIFRRDQGKVESLSDMQDMMRYNNYKEDPVRTCSRKHISYRAARCTTDTILYPGTCAPSPGCAVGFACTQHSIAWCPVQMLCFLCPQLNSSIQHSSCTAGVHVPQMLAGFWCC